MKTFATALMLALFTTGMAQAQSKPANAIEENSLKSMLENLGYEPKEIKYTDNRTGYSIQVKFKGYDAEMRIVLSPSGSNVWGVLNLAELKSEHNAEASRFVKLLQLNLTHGPCHFRISSDGKYLTLARGMFAKGLTAKELREHIEELLSTAEKTVEHWDVTKWTAAPAPDTVKALEMK